VTAKLASGSALIKVLNPYQIRLSKIIALEKIKLSQALKTAKLFRLPLITASLVLPPFG